jgi:hypothetical protein
LLTLLLFFKVISKVAETGCYIYPNRTEVCNDEHKDTLFITTNVGEFIFGGYKHGVIQWLIDGPLWKILGPNMPPQITEEIGFAVFNGKNDTANNE